MSGRQSLQTSRAVKPNIEISKFRVAENGTEEVPAIHFSNAPGTGVFLKNGTNLAFTVSTHERVFLSEDALTTHEPVVLYEAESVRPNTSRAGALYKKPNDPSLYWYVDGFGEVNLLTGEVHRNTTGRTIIVPEDNDDEVVAPSTTNPFTKTRPRNVHSHSSSIGVATTIEHDDMESAASSIALASSTPSSGRQDFTAYSDNSDVLDARIRMLVDERVIVSETRMDEIEQKFNLQSDHLQEESKRLQREAEHLQKEAERLQEEGVRIGERVAKGVSAQLQSTMNESLTTKLEAFGSRVSDVIAKLRGEIFVGRRDEDHPCAPMYEFKNVRDTDFDHPNGYIFMLDDHLYWRNPRGEIEPILVGVHPAQLLNYDGKENVSDHIIQAPGLHIGSVVAGFHEAKNALLFTRGETVLMSIGDEICMGRASADNFAAKAISCGAFAAAFDSVTAWDSLRVTHEGMFAKKLFFTATDGPMLTMGEYSVGLTEGHFLISHATAKLGRVSIGKDGLTAERVGANVYGIGGGVLTCDEKGDLVWAFGSSIRKIGSTDMSSENLRVHQLSIGSGELLTDGDQLRFIRNGKVHILNNDRYSAADGSILNPSFGFANSPSTGFYMQKDRIYVANRAKVAAAFSENQILATNGSFANPAYSFHDTPSSGMFMGNTGLEIVHGACDIVLGDNGINMNRVRIQAGSSADPRFFIGEEGMWSAGDTIRCQRFHGETMSSDHLTVKRMSAVDINLGGNDSENMLTVDGQRLMWRGIPIMTTALMEYLSDTYKFADSNIVLRATTDTLKVSGHIEARDMTVDGIHADHVDVVGSLVVGSRVTASLATIANIDTDTLKSKSHESKEITVQTLAAGKTSTDQLMLGDVEIKHTARGLEVSTESSIRVLNTSSWVAESGEPLKAGDVVGMNEDGKFVKVVGWNFDEAKKCPLALAMLDELFITKDSNLYYINYRDSRVNFADARNDTIKFVKQGNRYIAFLIGVQTRCYGFLLQKGRIGWTALEVEGVNSWNQADVDYDEASERFVVANSTAEGVMVAIASLDGDVFKMGSFEKCLRTRDAGVKVVIGSGSSYVVASGSGIRAGFINRQTMNSSFGKEMYDYDIENYASVVYNTAADLIVCATTNVAKDMHIRTYNFIGNNLEIHDHKKYGAAHHVQLVNSGRKAIVIGGPHVYAQIVDLDRGITFGLRYYSGFTTTRSPLIAHGLTVTAGGYVSHFGKSGIEPEDFIGIVQDVKNGRACVATRGGCAAYATGIVPGRRVYLDMTSRKFTDNAFGNLCLGMSLGKGILLVP